MAGEWLTFRLGDVCSKIGSGATPRGGSGVYLDHGDIALIRSQNIYNDGFHHDGITYLTQRHAAELANVEVAEHDVLLNITGDSVARSCQVDASVLPARVNQHVAIIRSDPSLLWPRFLRYYLVSPAMQAEMLSLAGAGATRNALTKGMIESVDVAAPADIDEQRAIAQILGMLDDKIELNRRMNETLEALAQALFKFWFIDATETGFPEGWREGTLGGVAENMRRTVGADQIDSSTPYIGLEHMPRRCIALSEWKNSDELESNKFAFRRGEILFGKLRPYFHKVGVAPLDGVCSTDILVMRPKEPEWFGFVLGHTSSIELVNHVDAASTGTKMPRTNWNDIARYEILLPPKRVAAAFTEKVEPLIERIIANIHESRTLAVLRNLLLPKLMSGELRTDGIAGSANSKQRRE